MFKYLVAFFSLILVIIGGFGAFKYALDYQDLSSYGKGFIWGNILLILMGGFLFFFAIKKIIKY